jgi:hypothetical protein
MDERSSTHCCPAPPCTSPSAFTPDAIALLSPTPQVAAIRAIAIDGACGPWSTEDTIAASNRADSRWLGTDPRTISQIVETRPALPMRSCTGIPRSSTTPGSIRQIPLAHQSATSATVGACC